MMKTIIRSVLIGIVLLLLTGCRSSSTKSGGDNYSVSASFVIKHAPIANAGDDQRKIPGSLVTLDGSESKDPAGGTLMYEWKIISKPLLSNASLDDMHSIAPRFTADLPGTYTIELIVKNTYMRSQPDKMMVYVNTPATLSIEELSCYTLHVGLDTVSNATFTLPETNDLRISFYTREENIGMFNTSENFSGTWKVEDNHILMEITEGNSDLVGMIMDINVSSGKLRTGSRYSTSFIVNEITLLNTLFEVQGIYGSSCDGSNLVPIANAGEDRLVFPQSNVILNGNNSYDPEGSTLTYLWSIAERPDGSQATIDDPTAVTPSFTADLYGTYLVNLIVNDGELNSAIDTIKITANTRPQANAGEDQLVLPGTFVTLNGSGSYDAEETTLHYIWELVSKPTGSQASLQDPYSGITSFRADLAGLYKVNLMVTDGEIASETDSVTIIAAQAGQLSQSALMCHTLRFAGTDPENIAFADLSIVFYSLRDENRFRIKDTSLSGIWEVTANHIFATVTESEEGSIPVGSIIGIDIAQSGILNVGDSYSVTIQVPSIGQTYTDSLSLIGINRSSCDNSNKIPIAYAGEDIVVSPGEPVYLNGEGVDPEGNDQLLFSWSLLQKPAGSNSYLEQPDTQNPTFLPDMHGTYIIGLIVNDNELNSTMDFVSVDVNNIPVANAGNNQRVEIGNTVILDGSESMDQDGDRLFYTWEITEVPDGSSAVLDAPHNITPSFSADMEGIYHISLIVDDGISQSRPDTVLIGAGVEIDVDLLSLSCHTVHFYNSLLAQQTGAEDFILNFFNVNGENRFTTNSSLSGTWMINENHLIATITEGEIGMIGPGTIMDIDTDNGTFSLDSSYATVVMVNSLQIPLSFEVTKIEPAPCDRTPD
jgi:hypothetical protein